MAAGAYTILQSCIVASLGKDSPLAQSLDKDWKGKLSIVCYGAAIALAFVNPWFSDAFYVFVALLWLIPDPRIEKVVKVEV